MPNEQVIPESAAWGTIPADAARHVANALAESENLDGSKTLRKIGQTFAADLGSPTSGLSGEFVRRN
jgi:Domain of unknown function (DUF5076)